MKTIKEFSESTTRTKGESSICLETARIIKDIFSLNFVKNKKDRIPLFFCDWCVNQFDESSSVLFLRG